MVSNSLPPPAKRNVETISSMEAKLLHDGSAAERLGMRVARVFGSPGFLVVHSVLVTVWIVVNVTEAFGQAPDPYPFSFLGLVVGMEFFFLTTFVLMNQHVQSQRQEQWSHLNLQICILTEQEVTKNVQMLDLICRRLGLQETSKDAEVKEFARPTPLEALAKEFNKRASAN
jgi:uncharacterized membrane protein